MSAAEYKQRLELAKPHNEPRRQSDEFYVLSDLIDAMPYPERIQLRKDLEAQGIQALRNLYFDYDNQTWIQ